LNMVKWLTDISKHSDGNREKRKEIDRIHISKAPNDVKTIKIADLIDNSLSICEYDKDFAKIYLKEKELLLPELIGGNIQLWDLANNILIKNKMELII
jgi:guanosine-3',5'-bis(diphosphate) 3'-pyrophosphohydrolase